MSTLYIAYARQSVVRRQRRRVMLAAKATGRGCFSSAHSPVWVGGVQGLVAARSKCGCGPKATNDEWHHHPVASTHAALQSVSTHASCSSEYLGCLRERLLALLSAAHAGLLHALLASRSGAPVTTAG
jgi:hypothetical protein